MASPCLICGAAPGNCRQDCPEEQLRQHDAEARAREARDRMERRAAGAKMFRHEGHAIGWYFQTRESWMGPKALPLEVETGRPSQGAENPARRAFAAVAWALRLAENDEKATEGGAPIATWLLFHHAGGMSYQQISMRGGEVWSTDQIKRRMARAHAVVRTRLVERGWIESEEARA